MMPAARPTSQNDPCSDANRRAVTQNAAGAKVPSGTLVEISRIDEPSHQPAAPEQFFKNRNRDDADRDSKDQEHRIVSGCRRRVTRRMADDRVIEKKGVVPPGRDQIRRRPRRRTRQFRPECSAAVSTGRRAAEPCETARIAAIETANRSQAGIGTTCCNASIADENQKGQNVRNCGMSAQ